MKLRLKMLLIALAAVCLVFAFGATAGAAKYVIRAATVLVDESPIAQSLYLFAKIVESQTNGDIEVQVFSGGKLGDERPNIEAAQLNNIQVATPSGGVLANFSKKIRVINLPFLLTDQKVAYKVLNESAVGQKLLDSLSEIGLIGLAFGDYGMRNLTSKKEIKNMADLKGLKIRTMKVPDHLALWKNMGANPTPIAFSELYTALQQGVADGQENPYETIFLSKFYEVQKYITVVGHIYDLQPIIMSKKFYDGLPQNYQKIVRNAAQIANKYLWYITGKQNDTFKQQCEKAGMTINYFSKEEMAKSLEVNKPLVDQIRNVAGDKLVDEYIAAVEEAKK